MDHGSWSTSWRAAARSTQHAARSTWSGGEAEARSSKPRGGEKQKNENPRTYTGLALKKGGGGVIYFLFIFSKLFLLRFWVFLGMRNPKTAKKTFCNFFGHGPKSHLMTQKIFFLGTCSIRFWPY
jgi:hypothetical protein